MFVAMDLGCQEIHVQLHMHQQQVQEIVISLLPLFPCQTHECLWDHVLVIALVFPLPGTPMNDPYHTHNIPATTIPSSCDCIQVVMHFHFQ